MDAPAMLTHKHVPEDVGLRNIAAEEEGGQQQIHRDEKQHKPVLKKVKDKVKKIKSTITGHGHGNGDEHERGSGGSNSSDEDEEDVAQREAEVEKGGYQEDVEDKPVVMESDPVVHGAPRYDSERIPATTEVKGDDAPGVRLGDLGGPVVEDPTADPVVHGAPMYDSERIPAEKDVKGDDAPGVRLGDLGGPVVEDPAAPRSKTPVARGGEDIGTTDVVRDFESMTVSDDPKQVGARKMDVDEHREAMPVSDGTGEEWKDAPTDATTDGATYTDRLKNTAAGTAEYGKKLASTAYEKAAGVGTAVASKAQQVTPGFGARGNAQDDSSATATAESMTVDAGKRDIKAPKEGMPVSNAGKEDLKGATTDAASGATYTDRLKDTAAGTTEYGKKLASTVYEKVAGVGARGNAQDDSSATATPESMTVGAGKRDVDEPREGMPVSNADTEELKDAATDATTDSASGATYTDKIKSTAAGTTGYGKKLASTVYEKVAGVGARGNAPDSSATVTPETLTVGAGKRDVDEPREGMPVSNAGTEELKDAATDATTQGASGATYTDKIKSAAAGTTEYGKKLASTVYEKVAGVGTAVTGKGQQVTPSAGTATPGVGAQDGSSATSTPGAGGPGNGQDKGVTGVTAYIAEKLRPGDEERSLSKAITGAMQQRKEGVGSTLAKAREAPAQAVTKAREAATSLTGGNRVSETVQPTTEGNIKEGVAVEGPELRGEEIGAAKTDTNI